MEDGNNEDASDYPVVDVPFKHARHAVHQKVIPTNSHVRLKCISNTFEFSASAYMKVLLRFRCYSSTNGDAIPPRRPKIGVDQAVYYTESAIASSLLDEQLFDTSKIHRHGKMPCLSKRTTELANSADPRLETLIRRYGPQVRASIYLMMRIAESNTLVFRRLSGGSDQPRHCWECMRIDTRIRHALNKSHVDFNG